MRRVLIIGVGIVLIIGIVGATEGTINKVVAENQVGKSETTDKSSRVDDIKKTTRVKRYPEHLDPNPFWIRIGECPTSVDGSKQHFCPTPTRDGRWVCVDDYQLCDGQKNCPGAEDESSNYCLFYRVLKSEVEMLSQSITALSSPNDDSKIRDDNDGGYVIVENPEESFVSRHHRQSGQFVPSN